MLVMVFGFDSFVDFLFCLLLQISDVLWLFAQVPIMREISNFHTEHLPLSGEYFPASNCLPPTPEENKKLPSLKLFCFQKLSTTSTFKRQIRIIRQAEVFISAQFMSHEKKEREKGKFIFHPDGEHTEWKKKCFVRTQRVQWKFFVRVKQQIYMWTHFFV